MTAPALAPAAPSTSFWKPVAVIMAALFAVGFLALFAGVGLLGWDLDNHPFARQRFGGFRR
jgi:hypothetical protein